MTPDELTSETTKALIANDGQLRTSKSDHAELVIIGSATPCSFSSDGWREEARRVLKGHEVIVRDLRGIWALPRLVKTTS